MILRHIIFFLLIIFLKAIFTAVETALNIKERKREKEDFFDADENILEKNDAISLRIAALSTINIIIVMSVGFLCTGDLINAVLDALFKGRYLVSHQFSFFIVLIFMIIILTYFTVLFGTIIPRCIANKNHKAVLRSGKAIIQIVYFILYPLVKLINISVNIVDMIFDISPNEEVTQEEIIQLINEGEEKGAIDENEKEMINNIFEFDNKTAGDIATHRTDIVAIPISSDVEEVIKIVKEEKYSRLPVYNENIDDIIGILHVKDVLKHLVSYGKENFKLSKHIMKPFFVPFTKKTDELFEQMQKNKIHMCIVIDEYGGTKGIVTMEDLIEEIMGNILDEYDDEEIPKIQKINENIYLIDGMAELGDVEQELKISIDNDEFDTISGFLISKIGKIPESDEDYQIKFNGFVFTIEKLDEKRISIVKAERIVDEENTAEEENKDIS